MRNTSDRVPMQFPEIMEPLVDILDEGETLKVVAEMAGVDNDINREVTDEPIQERTIRRRTFSGRFSQTQRKPPIITV